MRVQTDRHQQSVPRQTILRQTMDSKQFKGRPVSSQRADVTGQDIADQKRANKRSLVSMKEASANNTQYHDTSVERLLQEVTSDKFWHNPEESELQSVPGSFNLPRSTLEFLSLFFLRDAELSYTVLTRNLLRLYQVMHM